MALCILIILMWHKSSNFNFLGPSPSPSLFHLLISFYQSYHFNQTFLTRKPKGAMAPVIPFKNNINISLSPSFSLSVSPSLPPSFSLSLSLSLTGEEGVRTLFTGQRERERERERGRERECVWSVACMSISLFLSLFLSLYLWSVTACPHSKHSSFIQSVSMRDYYINY